MRNARDKNIGWRIDYFLVSKKMENKIKDSEILTRVLGSDHAPIKLKLKI
jgi:exodeoxyribonuclease-3